MTSNEAYTNFHKQHARLINSGDYAVDSYASKNILVIDKKGKKLTYLEFSETDEGKIIEIPFDDVQDAKFFDDDLPNDPDTYPGVVEPGTFFIRTTTTVIIMRLSAYDFRGLSKFWKFTKKRNTRSTSETKE